MPKRARKNKSAIELQSGGRKKQGVVSQGCFWGGLKVGLPQGGVEDDEGGSDPPVETHRRFPSERRTARVKYYRQAGCVPRLPKRTKDRATESSPRKGYYTIF